MRYKCVDLFLDTFPYNGHTTAGDALRAGLPVITLCGQSFASRVAASLLFDLGVPELACSSYQEYHDRHKIAFVVPSLSESLHNIQIA